MKFENLIPNKDYKYSFPYGIIHQPQIEILSGKYKGMILDLMSSSVFNTSEDEEYKLRYTFKLLKVWDSIESNKLNGSTITLDSSDSSYIRDLVYNFVRETNKKNKK